MDIDLIIHQKYDLIKSCKCYQMPTSRVKTKLFLTFEIAAKLQNVCYTRRSLYADSLNQPKMCLNVTNRYDRNTLRRMDHMTCAVHVQHPGTSHQPDVSYAAGSTPECYCKSQNQIKHVNNSECSILEKGH